MVSHHPRPFAGALALATAALLAPRVARPEEKATAALTVDLGAQVRLELVLVKAGRFQQGSPPAEPGRGDDERLREVTLTRDFYMGRYPVTRGQFARFVQETRYRTEAEVGASGGSGWDGRALAQRRDFSWKTPGFPQTDAHPVTLVTFGDAGAFARWLTRKTGRAFSLPTEAQWEYAYRAGTRTRYHAGDGDALAGAIGWFKGNAGDGTRPVGQKQPNAFGLHDMGGNVHEWCSDWYAPYSPGPAVDPEQVRPSSEADPPRRVLRGGSWLRDAKHLRAAARYRNTPGSRNADNGFRLVAATEVGTPGAGPLSSRSPDAPAGAAPDAPAGGESSSGTPMLVVAGMVAGGGFLASVFIGLVAVLVHRSRRSRRAVAPGPAAQAGPQGVTFHPRGDGFWIITPPSLRGATLHYRCLVRGALRRGAIALEPSPRGQFVYTGGAPTAIEAEQVGAAAWTASRPVAPAGPHATPGASAPAGHARSARRFAEHPASAQQGPRATSEPDSDPVPFHGFPPAY